MPDKRTIIVSYLKKNKLLVTGAIGAMLVNNILNVLLPVTIGSFSEVVLHRHGTKSRLMEMLHTHFSDASSFFIFFVLLIVLKAIANYLTIYWTGLVGERFSRDLRELAFAQQVRHKMSVHHARPVGNYLLRYSGDLLAIQNFISKGILGFTGDVIFLCGLITALWMLRLRLAVEVLAVFGIAVIVIYFLSKFVRTASLERRNQRSVTLGFVSARLQSFSTIKSFNRETPETKYFRKRSHKLYRLGVRFLRISSVVQTLLPLFFFFTVALILFDIFRSEQQVKVGVVLTFVLLLLYMQTVMKRILHVNVTWQVGIVSFDKMIALLRLPVETREGIVPGNVVGMLEAHDLSFSYPLGQSLFTKLSFKIAPGTITVFTGKQASGKSTLLKLLQRIYDPSEGELRLDNTEYHLLSPFAIRKNITIVAPDVPLVGRTYLDAIVYNKSPRNIDRAKRELIRLGIATETDCEGFLKKRLLEKGKNLSTGEQLLLQFARAFLTRKTVILIDSPLTDLGSHSRDIVIKRINKLRHKRTIIFATESVPPGLEVDQLISL